MEGTILIHPITDRHGLHAFIHLPEHLPDRRPNWLPPIWSDEFKFHDPEKNPALKHCEVVRFIARMNDHPVGRVMGIIHHTYNAQHGERTARFHQLDVINDQAVAEALLQHVEDWAREHGMEALVGPFGISDKDPQGAQVEGFEHLPVLATATNPSFLPALIEGAGFQPFRDLVVYRLDIPEEIPSTYQRIAERVLRNGDLRAIGFKNRSSLKPWILPVLRLVNEAYAGVYGFVPMTEEEMMHLAETYLPVLDPRFIFIIVDPSDRPAAFVVAIPDMSEGIRKAGGRLFPFGFLRVIWAMRHTRQLDLFLGGVHPAHQGRGLTTLLGVELFHAAKAHGLTFIDSHLVLETNMRMRAELERLGGKIYKRYRIYRRELSCGDGPPAQGDDT
jgi:GNAT superfamily N-acetyltransferase